MERSIFLFKRWTAITVTMPISSGIPKLYEISDTSLRQYTISIPNIAAGSTSPMYLIKAGVFREGEKTRKGINLLDTSTIRECRV